jgi:hypothetical protein
MGLEALNILQKGKWQRKNPSYWDQYWRNLIEEQNIQKKVNFKNLNGRRTNINLAWIDKNQKEWKKPYFLRSKALNNLK